MQTLEGALAQRLILKLIIVVLVESGALNRDDAWEGFQTARRRIAATVQDAALRNRIVQEIDALLKALECCGERQVH